MFRSYLRLLLFTLGLLLGVQVPGFIDDYAKRVDAHRLEAAQNIQGFQQTAGQFFNGSLEELVRHYRSNSDPVFQRDGENLDRLMRRARMLDAEWQAMQGPWYARAWHMLRAPNHELLMETCQLQLPGPAQARGDRLGPGLRLAGRLDRRADRVFAGLAVRLRRRPPHPRASLELRRDSGRRQFQECPDHP